MKKIFSIILTLLLLCIPNFQSLAMVLEPNLNSEKTTVINEYDNYLSIVSKTDKQLKNDGMTNEEIKYIRNFNYEEEIKNRAKLSNDTLKTYGYTEKDIKELRSAAEMDNIPTSVLKSISTSTVKSSVKYTKKGTMTEGGATVRFIDLFFEFTWTKIPFFVLNDMVAIGFHSDGATEYVYKKVSNYKFVAETTTLLNGKKSDQTIDWTYKVSNNIPSVNAKFALGLKNSNSELTKFTYHGEGTFRLTNRDTKARLYVDAAYGHTTINIVPTYSISISGAKVDIGIKFAIGMDTQHNRGYYLSNLTIIKDYVYEGTVQNITV